MDGSAEGKGRLDTPTQDTSGETLKHFYIILKWQHN